MSTSPDLTRWNRAGLRRFRYIQGNAVEYMESLRAEFGREQRFPQWLRASLPGNLAEEDPILRLERIVGQYHGERGDWAWEVARAFARATHILAEHIDAYANEGYLGTASQWDSLRRLVEMLDYHPAPPASASTLFVLEAKPEMSGLVTRGFQVKHNSPKGGPAVVFETLQDITVDARLNALRHAGWDRSVASFNPFDPTDPTGKQPPHWRGGDDMKLSVGQPAVLVQAPEGHADHVSLRAEAVAIATFDASSRSLALGLSPNEQSWRKGYTQLLVAPKKTHRPRLNGRDLLTLEREHNLAAGDVTAWQGKGAWHFDDVLFAEGVSLLSAGAPPLNAVLRKAVLVAPVINASGVAEYRVPLDIVTAASRTADGNLHVLELASFDTATAVEKGGYKFLKASVGELTALYIVRPAIPSAGQVVALGSSPHEFTFNGSADGLASGMWVVAEGDGVAQAMSIERVVQQEDFFVLTLALAPGTSGNPSSQTLAELLVLLRRAETALDHDVFTSLRLRDLAGGAAATREVTDIQGVRSGTGSYSFLRLAAVGINTIGDLARVDTATRIAGIGPVRLLEFKAHAESLVGFRCDVVALRGLLDARLTDIIEGTATGTVVISQTWGDMGMTRLDRLYGPFRFSLRPLGYDRNLTPLTGHQIILTNDGESLPESLKRGRSLLLMGEPGAMGVRPRQLMIDSINGHNITLSRPIDVADGYTYGNLLIRANVVAAGHGESRGEALLGSGSATDSNAEYVFSTAGVSFVADPTMPAGVRADIKVRVAGQTWEQVSSLRDSDAADSHYTARMTEDGFLRIGFGDGRNGRRLPSGTNNLRVEYRLGAGLAGNLPPASLETPVKPHRLIAAVAQPLPATGGNDMEDVAALRENAPASLLTLERAVSLQDFANLAASQSAIWQARAFTRPVSYSRQETIEVVVVPAGGAAIDGDFNADVPQYFLDEQRDFLLAHALPGVAVSVVRFRPVLVDLHITVRVISAEYDPLTVADAMRSALLNAFGLRRRKLGQSLHRSEVFGVVEEVRGVENSDCRIDLTLLTGSSGVAKPATPRRLFTQAGQGGASIRSIVPDDQQVVYLDDRYSTLTVRTEEYRL